MSGFNGAVSWAGKHPITTAVGAFALGAVLLLMLKGGGGSAASSGGNASAFFAAQAQQAAIQGATAQTQAQSNAAVAINQANVTGSVQIASIGGATSEDLANINATSQLNLTNAEGWWQHILAHNYNVGESNNGPGSTNVSTAPFLYNPPTFGSAA